MNFWEFLDRNIGPVVVFILVIVFLVFMYGLAKL